MKKINELVTLCGVKACAIVYDGPNDASPEAWPSRSGAEEVISKFMEFPEVEREKKMYNQEIYTRERIVKERGTLQRLQEENREIELKEIMFDLLKGKRMIEHHSNDARALCDLLRFIKFYDNELAKRIHMLEANGEPISFTPLDHVGVVDAAPPGVGDHVNPIADADVAAVTMPFGLFDHIQNMNMNQQAPSYLNDHIPYPNMNQQELGQYQVPTYFPDHVPYQNMMNHQNQFQYQVPNNVYDQNQHGFYGLNQGMGMSESLNQYPNMHDQPYMNQWMAQPQQMSYAEELSSLAPVDNNNYNYHQLPSTSYMPSMDLSALNTNNLPTRFGLE
ncbi:hypothetical protein N665_0157s0021 [Sinapis alba]|nr:hypothetical protein N665_0157s0021 [Sinapis alba]